MNSMVSGQKLHVDLPVFQKGDCADQRLCSTFFERRRGMGKIMLSGFIFMATVTLFLCADCAQAKRGVDAIVTTQWLADNMGNKSLVLLDVRAPDNYLKGHIPGAVNFPALGNFFINLFSKETPWMEVPEKSSLFATMGKAGITGDSIVVVVGRSAGPMAVYAIADATRVAITLLYAGIENVAVLDGGYDKWASEGKQTSTQAVKPISGTYDGDTDEGMFVTKEYVEKVMGKSVLIDARDSDSYFGLTQAPWEKRGGHIPTAKLLSTPWLWKLVKNDKGVLTYGIYKDRAAAREMASTVIGKEVDKEVIVYCGVGGYASTMYYVLTQVVGYKNVKIFDGSMQVWTDDPDAPVVKYKYQ
jgi:thiosulfate/3-mercaptopyruvate sulfurtransferase